MDGTSIEQIEAPTGQEAASIYDLSNKTTEHVSVAEVRSEHTKMVMVSIQEPAKEASSSLNSELIDQENGGKISDSNMVESQSKGNTVSSDPSLSDLSLPSGQYSNLNLDAIHFFEDQAGFHFILDKTTKIADMQELAKFEQFPVEGTEGVVMHIQRGVSDRDPVKCVAVSFRLDRWDVQSATQTLNLKMNDWMHILNSINRRAVARDVCYDPRTGRRIAGSQQQSQKSATENACFTGERPTFFNLLEALANNNLTTAEQRQCIRDIVTDFLSNELPHGQVYAYIGAVIGYDVLHTIIRKLEDNPRRSPIPDAQGLARIETAFGLSRATSSGNQTGKAGASRGFSSDSPVVSALLNRRSSPQQNFVGMDANKKAELITSLRQKFANKRYPQNISNKEAVFDKVKWVPIRRPLSPTPIYGHTIISFSNKAFVFGGCNECNNPMSFKQSVVFNLQDFSSRISTFTGNYPCERDGHSANLITLKNTATVLIFGGFSRDGFLNDVYLLDIAAKRWSRQQAAGVSPPPRDQHSAVVYPARSDGGNIRVKIDTELLIVFGGRTGNKSQMTCLNDMWAFSLATCSWNQIMFTSELRPCPRFGASIVWADDYSICIFGGETHAAGGTISARSREILDDMWIFKVKNVENDGKLEKSEAPISSLALEGTWERERYSGKVGPHAHCPAVFITQRYQEPRGDTRTIERLMVIASGVTSTEGGSQMPIVKESDQLYVYFFSQKKWCTIKPRYPTDYTGSMYGARQRHVFCFFEACSRISRDNKPPVPCLFIQGGFREHQALSDGWVLSLTGEDPFKCNNMPYISPQAHVLHPGMMGRPVSLIRQLPTWYQRDSHTPGLLWAFCGAQRWAFGALAQLIDNSLHSNVASRNLSIKWETTPDLEGMISIQDDGQGLDYPAMNKLLRLYGTYEPGDRSRRSFEYGCGFKLAFSRLSSSCIVISRTVGTIGIGMLSQELMGHCDAKELAAPLCVWRLPNKEIIDRDPRNMADQRHHQKLLMTYTPFTNPTLLAQQINNLGISSGTRILFWDLRDDLDVIRWDPEENSIYLSGLPETVTKEKTPSVISEDTPKDFASEDPTRPSVGHLLKTPHTALYPPKGPEILDILEEEENPVCEGVEASLEDHERAGKRESSARPPPPSEDLPENSVSDTRTGDSSGDVARDYTMGGGGAASTSSSAAGCNCPPTRQPVTQFLSQSNASSSTSSEYEIPKVGMLSPFFPLWQCAKHAPDYYFASYLYWLYLHNKANIEVQNVKLLPSKLALQKKFSGENEKIPLKADKIAASSNSKDELVHEAEAIDSAASNIADSSVADEVTAGMQSVVDAQDSAHKRNVSLKEEDDSAFLAERKQYASLYKFLKHRLFLPAELSYLFTPADSDVGCYALIGFLNNPDEEVSMQNRVCEAGICLYYKDRLIHRMEGIFPENPRSIEKARYPPPPELFKGKITCRYPVTAVINVHDWMIPTMTKQEFLHDSSCVFFKFKSKLTRLISEYLSVCRNPQKLKEWLTRREMKLREYQDQQRRSLRGHHATETSEDEADEESVVKRRSPTPSISHHTTGVRIWSGPRRDGGGPHSATHSENAEVEGYKDAQYEDQQGLGDSRTQSKDSEPSGLLKVKEEEAAENDSLMEQIPTLASAEGEVSPSAARTSTLEPLQDSLPREGTMESQDGEDENNTQQLYEGETWKTRDISNEDYEKVAHTNILPASSSDIEDSGGIRKKRKMEHPVVSSGVSSSSSASSSSSTSITIENRGSATFLAAEERFSSFDSTGESLAREDGEDARENDEDKELLLPKLAVDLTNRSDGEGRVLLPENDSNESFSALEEREFGQFEAAEDQEGKEELTAAISSSPWGESDAFQDSLEALQTGEKHITEGGFSVLTGELEGRKSLEEEHASRDVSQDYMQEKRT